MEKGKFIVFEGIDGSGKTTQIQLLANRLKRAQFPVHLTKEPTDGPIGSMARNVLNKRLILDEQTVAALFLADRLDHIQNSQNGMLQHQKKGSIVLLDRYYLSSYAYHSAFVPLDWVIQANSICQTLMQPDIIFFLDVPPEVSIARLRASRGFLDLYETETRLKTVRANYLKAIEKVKAQENIHIIDATQPIEAIELAIWKIIMKYLY